jgi:hypothetical protein
VIATRRVSDGDQRFLYSILRCGEVAMPRRGRRTTHFCITNTCGAPLTGLPVDGAGVLVSLHVLRAVQSPEISVQLQEASAGPNTPSGFVVRLRTNDLVQSPNQDFRIVRRRTAKELFMTIPGMARRVAECLRPGTLMIKGVLLIGALGASDGTFAGGVQRPAVLNSKAIPNQMR